MNNLQYHIESFCREHGIEAPMFWNLRQDDNDLYAVSLHLHANDRWEEFDARAVFVLYNCSDRDSKEAEKTLLLQMFRELGEPLVLTIKDSVSPSKQRFFKEFGMTMAPVRWSDNDNTLRHISTSKSRGWNPSLERVKKSPTMLFIELSAEREGFALGPKGRFHKAKRLKERENPVRIRNKKRTTKCCPFCCGERGIRARPEGTLSQSEATERT